LFVNNDQSVRLQRAIRAQWPPMNHAEFARRMGVSKSLISRYLSGSRQEPAKFWAAAAHVLDCELDTLTSSEEGAAAA
jgi:transcriptional regulator with XRE-family HTH domain